MPFADKQLFDMIYFHTLRFPVLYPIDNRTIITYRHARIADAHAPYSREGVCLL